MQLFYFSSLYLPYHKLYHSVRYGSLRFYPGISAALKLLSVSPEFLLTVKKRYLRGCSLGTPFVIFLIRPEKLVQLFEPLFFLFIQYTYARIRSVLRKAAEQGIVLPEQLPTTTTISEKEENLIQMIADYASVVREAGKEYSPALIANYTYDLVKEYNQFYHDFSILREENEEVKEFRLVLSANVAKIVKSAMSLLGIEVPERM